MYNRRFKIITGLLSLVSLLIYTFIHTGGLLSRYVDPYWGGYVCAFGIELAVVSLSLGIGELRRYKQGFRFYLFVLIAVVAVSALANTSEGFYTNQGVMLTVQTVYRLDPIQAIIGLFSTGLISLIVLALSEIVGTDVQQIVLETEKHRRNEQKKAEIDTSQTQIETAREVAVEQARDTKAERIQDIVNAYRDNPEAKPVDVYRRLDIPRATFYAYLNELVEDGIISKNGNGVKVIG